MKKYINKIKEIFIKILVSFSVNKKKYFLIGGLALFIILLAIPLISRAFVFDPFAAALEGVEEAAGPFIKFYVKIFLYYIIAYGLLNISSWLLEESITRSSEMSIINSNIVQTGWSFVANISNMLVIIGLVFIALMMILGVKTINLGKGVKQFSVGKALPKVLIAAFLINFSLLIVGGAVDITNIVYRTIFSGNETVVTEVTNTLLEGLEINIAIIAGVITVAVATMAIPFVAPVAQVAFALGMLTEGFRSTVLVMVIQLACSLILSIVYFLLSSTFIIRIFMMQFLAILSPIALVSIVLPFTEQYWKMWLKELGTWTVVGIPVLMFLVIGFRSIDALFPGPKDIFHGGTNEFLIYYVALIIFLITAHGFAKKQTPQLINDVISGIKKGGMPGIKKYVAPLGKAVNKSWNRAFEYGAVNWGNRGNRSGQTTSLTSANRQGQTPALASPTTDIAESRRYQVRTTTQELREKGKVEEENTSGKDYYSILGVSKTASPEEVHAAYRNLSKKYHPDMEGGDENKMKELSEAYAAYKADQKRGQGTSQGSDQTRQRTTQESQRTTQESSQTRQKTTQEPKKEEPKKETKVRPETTQRPNTSTASNSNRTDSRLKDSLERWGYNNKNMVSLIAKMNKLIKKMDSGKLDRSDLRDPVNKVAITLNGDVGKLRDFIKQGIEKDGQGFAKRIREEISKEIEKNSLNFEAFRRDNPEFSNYVNSPAGRILFGKGNWKTPNGKKK